MLGFLVLRQGLAAETLPNSGLTVQELQIEAEAVTSEMVQRIQKSTPVRFNGCTLSEFEEIKPFYYQNVDSMWEWITWLARVGPLRSFLMGRQWGKLNRLFFWKSDLNREAVERWSRIYYVEPVKDDSNIHVI